MSFETGDLVAPRAPFQIPGTFYQKDGPIFGVVVRREATGLYTVDWDYGYHIRTGWTLDTLAPVNVIDRLARLLPPP